MQARTNLSTLSYFDICSVRCTWSKIRMYIFRYGTKRTLDIFYMLLMHRCASAHALVCRWRGIRNERVERSSFREVEWNRRFSDWRNQRLQSSYPQERRTGWITRIRENPVTSWSLWALQPRRGFHGTICSDQEIVVRGQISMSIFLCVYIGNCRLQITELDQTWIKRLHYLSNSFLWLSFIPTVSY